MRKSVAAWLLVWMLVLAFGQEALFAKGSVVLANGSSSSGSTKVDAATQKARLAQLGTNPVDINHKTNWDTDNIFVLVRRACGQLQFKDPKTNELRWGYYCLPPGIALDVPRGSTFTLVKDDLKRQEWLNVGVLGLPTGQATVTMCGNGFKPEEHMIGKLDTGRQCQACEAKTEYIAPPPTDTPGARDVCPNLPEIQYTVPNGMTIDRFGNCQPSVATGRRVWPWIVGAIGAGLLGYALSKGGGDDDDCDTCPGRIPKPAP